MVHVVIVGGGIAALESALYLSRHGIKPLVFTGGNYYISGPSRPLLLSGEQTLDRITRGYIAISYADILFERVLSVDMENRRVITSRGEYPYDYLIIATGIVADYTRFKGVLNVYDIGRLTYLKHLIWNIKEGNILVSAPPQPYKCAPGPLETLFTIDMILRYRGVRDKIELLFVDANKKLQPPLLHDVWKERLEEAGVEYVTGVTVEEVNGDEVVLSDGERMETDIPVVLPPNTGVSPLGNGFLVVRGPHDLRLKGFDDVYSVGDVAKLPYPKNSEIASISARVAASQIVEDLGKGERLKEPYRFVGWAYAGNLRGEIGTESIKFSLTFTSEGTKGEKDDIPKKEYTETKDRWEQGILKKLFGY